MREGTHQLLVQAGGYAVVAETETADETVAACQSLHPDVALVDMRLRVGTGIDVTKRVRAAGLPVKILILTAFDDDQYLFPALAAGADGYLLKTSSSATLLDALVKVAAGQTVLDPAVTSKVLQRMRKGQDAGAADGQLTDREREVVAVLVHGGSNRQIAQALNISTFTVQVHLRNIFAKFQVSNRTEAVAYALAHGLASLTE